ncbi:MAG: TonB-dependent receptor domain-containing protein [Flavobacteriales bacterium]
MKTTPFLFIITLLLFQLPSLSQETTGKLQGKIYDVNREPIPGANIILKETSTGSIYGTSAKFDGFFAFNQVPSSSHYEIEVSFIGYNTYKKHHLIVSLGKTTALNITLNESSESLEEIVLEDSSAFSNPKNGNEYSANREQIDKIPTINRSIQDLTSVLPEANLNSFGGASNRFNNLNIDGMVNNDVIGFQEPASGAAGSTATGSPGALSKSQPIGFGAVKELSVKLSPFDLSIGNFTGANINVVTKNGTNQTHGSIYAFGLNQNLLGRYSDGVKQSKSNFYDVQFGGGIGGAIKKNKSFYYVNFEQTLREESVLNAPGSSGSTVPLSEVEAISNHLINKYNYNPGTHTSSKLQRKSSKLFTRLDFNLSTKHKLTLRNNLVKSESDQLEWNANFFNFGNQGFTHTSLANSLLAELRSQTSDVSTNKLTVGYNHVVEDRDYDGRVFPHLEIDQGSSNTIFAGSYREASVFGNTQNTLQINDKFQYFKNRHTLSLGAGGEYSAIEYRFLSAWNGRWKYNSVEDFLNDNPSRIRGVYNIENNNYDYNRDTPSADFGILTWNTYFQDEFRANDKLTLTAGVRLDGIILSKDLPVSSEIKLTPEFSHFDNSISKQPTINPRIGLNYELNKNVLIRGGAGYFSGRIPNLWFAYAEYISGTKYFNVDYKPTESVDITEDLSELSNLQPGLTEINLIDNDFKLPRDFKINLATDLKLPKQFTLSLEGTYSKVINGIFFQSINRKEERAQFSGADNRSYYALPKDEIKINSNFTNVFLLKNTDKGYRYNLTASLTKTAKHYFGNIAYTYGKSMDISSTVRNSHAANYEWNQTIVGNDPQLSSSNFDLRHRIVSFHSYDFHLKSGNKFSLGLQYTGRSGSPYSFIYNGDINNDGSSKNDLIYIPKTSDDISFQAYTDNNGVYISENEQWEMLNNYIEGNDYLKKNRGKYAERNGAKTPWNHEINLKAKYTLELKQGKKIAFSLDIFNLPNLISKKLGRLVYAPNVVNSSYRLIDFKAIENNRPVFEFKEQTGKPWQVDNLNSRWKAQFGVHYSF